MKFKINNKNWEIKEVDQERMREELKKHNDSIVNVNTKMYNFSNLLMHKIVHF